MRAHGHSDLHGNQICDAADIPPLYRCAWLKFIYLRRVAIFDEINKHNAFLQKMCWQCTDKGDGSSRMAVTFWDHCHRGIEWVVVWRTEGRDCLYCSLSHCFLHCWFRLKGFTSSIKDSETSSEYVYIYIYMYIIYIYTDTLFAQE